MPTLNWIGKSAVVNHDQQVPYRLIHCDGDLSVGEAGEGNLLVEGDNLQALKALLPYYRKQVKCIYIDPPYNTGNEGWVYNDAVNSPEIKKWLGEAVGGEAEDLSRHDKWLCMMYPRLVLLREFLRDDGAIFISIDDNEAAHLRCVMDEIFRAQNFVASIVWQKRTSPDARLNLGPAHDYIIVYAKSIFDLKQTLNLLPLNRARAKDYKNPDNDPRGTWASVDLTGQTGHATPSQYYEVQLPNGKKYRPPEGRCWALAESTFHQLAADGRVWFGKKGNARPRLKRFLSETEGHMSWTWWPNTEVGHNQEATKELNDLVGVANTFETPKPTRLIQRILQLATDKDSLVLDSFAGSGTTGHAVLQLNKEDGGNRRFILIEMEPEICRSITAERLKRVIGSRPHRSQRPVRSDGEESEGLGGGFRYCTLGESLFDERGQIRDKVKFGDLAHHIFFTETGEPLPKRVAGRNAFIGEMNGTAYYLLWSGAEAQSILTVAALKQLKAHDGPKVIYADACRLSPAQLQKWNVVFKQIPYEVRAG